MTFWSWEIYFSVFLFKFLDAVVSQNPDHTADTAAILFGNKPEFF